MNFLLITEHKFPLSATLLWIGITNIHFLYCIFIGDEKWVSHINSKRQQTPVINRKTKKQRQKQKENKFHSSPCIFLVKYERYYPLQACRKPYYKNILPVTSSSKANIKSKGIVHKQKRCFLWHKSVKTLAFISLHRLLFFIICKLP